MELIPENKNPENICQSFTPSLVLGTDLGRRFQKSAPNTFLRLCLCWKYMGFKHPFTCLAEGNAKRDENGI
ncbi:MAG: hypothetical protein LC658_16085 [Bacteroidales bacterium]|nr:hypothetical protein [Bacteroidales bacterium]